MAEVVRRLPLVREVWDSNLEPIKIYTWPTTRHRCNLDCVDLGAKPRRWAPLTRDTRKGIKRI